MVVRPCLDCHRPTRNGSRCPDCQERWTLRREHRRGTRTERGYDNEWLLIAAEAIEAQPWCSVPGCRRTDLTGDHIVPVSRGGASTHANVGVLCRHHNSSRGNREWAAWLAEASRAER